MNGYIFVSEWFLNLQRAILENLNDPNMSTYDFCDDQSLNMSISLFTGSALTNFSQSIGIIQYSNAN